LSQHNLAIGGQAESCDYRPQGAPIPTTGDEGLSKRDGLMLKSHQRAITLIFLFAHDLFGKPASTFPDHALAAVLGSHSGTAHKPIRCSLQARIV
jgi:hypothetical protein